MAHIEREKAIDEIDKWLDSVGYVTVGKGLTSYGELVANLVSRCKEMNVGCNIQFFPIEKEKKDGADND